MRVALKTNKYATTTKTAGVHPDTLRKWMKGYEAEIHDQMGLVGTNITPVEPTEKEYKKNMN